MKIIEDEVIGELRYLTVEFDQAELLAGHIGVISQGAVRRYFEGKNPDLKVKKCGGLKLDSQRDIVTMRFGVVKKSTTVTIIDEFAGPDNDYSAAQKLLNPGYDEIQAKAVNFQREYDVIVVLYDKLEVRYSGLIEKYDALVIAVGKDAQKFSAMLVENEELKEQLSKLQLDKLNGVLAGQEIDLTSDDENPRPTENEVDKMLEDTADLVPTKEITLKEAKKIMEENEKYPGQYQV